MALITKLCKTLQFPDAKTVQINLTGFMESNTSVFMSELWEMLVSAQSNIGGVPSSILEAKKAEILAAKVGIDMVPAHKRRARALIGSVTIQTIIDTCACAMRE